MEHHQRFDSSLNSFDVNRCICRLGDIAITTSSKRDRLEDFLKTTDENFQLSDEDVKAIDDAGAKLHFRKYWTKEIDGQKEDL